METEIFLKMNELCETFSLDKAKIHSLVEKERIPFNKTKEGWVRFWLKDFLAWYEDLDPKQKKFIEKKKPAQRSPKPPQSGVGNKNK